MVAVIVDEIVGPAVMGGRVLIAGDNADGLDGFAAPLWMDALAGVSPAENT